MVRGVKKVHEGLGARRSFSSSGRGGKGISTSTSVRKRNKSLPEQQRAPGSADMRKGSSGAKRWVGQMGFASLGTVRPGCGGRGGCPLPWGKLMESTERASNSPQTSWFWWHCWAMARTLGAAPCPWDWARVSTPQPPDAQLQNVF